MIALINSFLSPLQNIIKNNRKYIAYFLLFLSFLSLGFLFYPDSTKDSGEKALIVLWVILWIPIFSRVMGLHIARELMPLRKELGILMGTLAFVHGWWFIITYPELVDDTSFWWVRWFVAYTAFGFATLVLTIPLALTSSDWAQKKLGKNWKRLHRLVYIIIILTIAHVVMIKFYRYFDVVPVIFLWLYFCFKILEWRGVTLYKKENKTYPLGQKWLCVPCGYIYDPDIWDLDSGIVPGTEFSDIADDWRCPVCGVTKADFVPHIEWQEQETLGAKIFSKRFLNPTTIELSIETKDDWQSQVWQFISFVWGDDQWEFTRQYSIVRQERRRFTFLIKLTDSGRWSQILRNIELDADIRIKWVFGTFRLQDSKNLKVFIATGTGLAPIYNMICSLPIDRRGTLYFSTGTTADLFYVDELKRIEWLNLHIHTTREKVLGCTYWRVDVNMIPSTPETEWYLCGSPLMVTEAVGKLTKKGYTRIYKEEF